MFKKIALLCLGVLSCTLTSCKKEGYSTPMADRITGNYTCNFVTMGTTSSATVVITKQSEALVTVSLPSFSFGTDVVSIALPSVQLTDLNNKIGMEFDGAANYTFNGQTLTAYEVEFIGTVTKYIPEIGNELNAVVNITLTQGDTPIEVLITGSR